METSTNSNNLALCLHKVEYPHPIYKNEMSFTIPRLSFVKGSNETMYVGCKSGNVDNYVHPLPKAASSVIIVNVLSTLDIVRSLGKKAGHEGSTL